MAPIGGLEGFEGAAVGDKVELDVVLVAVGEAAGLEIGVGLVEAKAGELGVGVGIGVGDKLDIGV